MSASPTRREPAPPKPPARAASTTPPPPASSERRPASAEEELEQRPHAQMSSFVAVIKNAFGGPLSLELENKGSVARDHLALERTYLAWLRTALGLVSLGIAVAQLFKIPDLFDEENGPTTDASLLSLLLNRSPSAPAQLADAYAGVLHSTKPRNSELTKLAKPLGASFIALGIIVLLLGSFRYFTVQTILVRGRFLPSRIEISLISLCAGALIVASLAVVIGGRISSA